MIKILSVTWLLILHVFICQSIHAQSDIIKHKYHWAQEVQDSTWGYTNAVLVDNVLYLSGIVGPGDFPTQVSSIYQGIENLLAHYGAGFENVVKETVYTTMIDSMKHYNHLRLPFYKSDFPAATWVQISRLFLADRDVEIEVVAHLPKDKATFQQLRKLAGTWIISKPGYDLYESWIWQNDSTLKGKSFMVKGTDTTTLENIQLTQKTTDIFYQPLVSDQNNGKIISFKLTAFSGNSFTFENPQHDYPKRIIYRFTGEKNLHASIDNGTEDAGKSSDFYFVKQ